MPFDNPILGLVAWTVANVLLLVVVPAGLIWFAVRLIRALERRGSSAERLAELSTRMGRIEERLEQVAADVDRLEESQRSTAQAPDGRPDMR